MKSKKRYTKNDRVLVKSFAGPDTCVVLLRRYAVCKSRDKLGVDGWDAQIINQKEVDKLRKPNWMRVIAGVAILLSTSAEKII